jgi:hypothetical protein
MKKRLAFLLSLVLVTTSFLTACGGYKGLDSEVSGELTIMLWSGDGSFMEDIGHQDLAPEDLKGQNQAAAYATAKAFNEIYPNVKINVFAKVGGPHDNDTTWDQERENFKAEHGHYPDIFATTNLMTDVSRGLVADLSVFENDPLYKSFNPAIMDMMNYSGVQAALPQYLLPWGVFVNKSLAEDNNLDVPSPDWDLKDYTNFIRQADNEAFFGSMDLPRNFVVTGTNSVAQAMRNDEPVDFNTDAVKEIVDEMAKWSNYSVWSQNALGNIPSEYMDASWWWGFKFFIDNKLLTLEGDPWMMGDAAHPSPDHWGRAQASDWDIYPRPATSEVGNTVGVVLDPMSVYNYALEDGNAEMSDAEYEKLQLAYTFMSFWVGDTAAIQARADQLWMDGENLKTSLNDSLPLVTGEDFTTQMDVWYTTDTHARYADEALMPGFHEILRLWDEGEVWDVSDKTAPWFVSVDGANVQTMDEMLSMANPDVAGAAPTDANWADNVKAKLADWTELANGRIEQAKADLNAGLTEYYGK